MCNPLSQGGVYCHTLNFLYQS
nr:unnamed protein product [Callosobruchus analis]